MTDAILFILAVSLLAAPGPTNVLLATAGALGGVRASLVLLLGALGGYVIAVATLRLALGPAVATFPAVGVALKVAVALYLAWVAFKLWTRGASLTGEGVVTLREVFVTTLLNPKSLAFAFGVFPAEHPLLWVFVAAFVVSVPVVGLGWVLIGRAIGAASGGRHARLVRKVSSMTLAGFAVLLVGSAFG